jgi:hypothetical protein
MVRQLATNRFLNGFTVLIPKHLNRVKTWHPACPFPGAADVPLRAKAGKLPPE